MEIRGGFLIPELEFQKESMRFNIMEANLYAATVVASYGYDVLGKINASAPSAGCPSISAKPILLQTSITTLYTKFIGEL